MVYNGVEVEAFASRWQDEALVSRVREPYYLTDEPTVLFAGKLRESKGVHILLAAMERVWQSLPLTVLVLVGGTEYGRRTMRETPFLQELRQQIARARGRVVLTGFIPPAEMPGAYLLGDVFVGPSQIEEGLGLVFLEAAAAGLPVIATRAWAASPRWCGTAKPACCWNRKTTPGNWRTRSSACCGISKRREKDWASRGGSGCGRTSPGKKSPDSLEAVYDEVRNEF